jgi:primosomal protein N' (replication factor Y) (superfamily II helicase)
MPRPHSCARVRTKPMPTYLEIAVNVPQIAGVYHYHLPARLEGKVWPGHLVEAPFGQQTVQGVALRYISYPEVPQTRPVLGLIDPLPALTPVQIQLAEELARVTLSPLAACIDLMLPPGLSQIADLLYCLEATADKPPGRLSQVQSRLVELLVARGPLRGRQIDQSMGKLNWRKAAQGLVRRGLVSSRTVLPPPSVGPKNVRTAQLACSPLEVSRRAGELGRAGSAAVERRTKILHLLIREAGPVDVPWVYAESGGNSTDLRYLAERGFITLGESEVWRDPLAQVEYATSEPLPLTTDQEVAWRAVQAGLQAAFKGQPVPPFLLHGVTGSGKTEVYLYAVDEALQAGRSAIVLVPEIALTPQTVRRFLARFPGQVGLLHSRLSPGERYDTWRRARAGLLSVMVGPRSALFTPFEKLGLVIVDEFHDDSYYQSDTPPRYHARVAAMTYARLSGGVCLLGSATPDVTSRYRAERQGWRYLSLPKRILAHREVIREQAKRVGGLSQYKPAGELAEGIELPLVQVVDMRDELKAGSTSIFSRALQVALKEVLAQRQQTILFLNRRGTATYVFCRDCGYSLKCPRCDLPLTYHLESPDQPHFESARGALLCHRCGYDRQVPKRCPQCGGKRVRHYGTGTQRVESEVQSLLPGVRVLRWDAETTRHKGAHEMILNHFANQHADILVGTQMLAKGLDLPLVTLVGVVLADVGLNLPDYRAGERTFQVLTQVAGRAGRSPLGGKVVLQTFQPDNYVIQAAAQHDYMAFYKKELAYRRKLAYPPFSRLVRLEYREPDGSKAERAAKEMADQLRAWIQSQGRSATEISGPTPCFFARVGGNYRWQILLRGLDPASLLRGRNLGDWRIEVDPTSLL